MTIAIKIFGKAQKNLHSYDLERGNPEVFKLESRFLKGSPKI